MGLRASQAIFSPSHIHGMRGAGRVRHALSMTNKLRNSLPLIVATVPFLATSWLNGGCGGVQFEHGATPAVARAAAEQSEGLSLCEEVNAPNIGFEAPVLAGDERRLSI